jgi:hypothetical protein
MVRARTRAPTAPTRGSRRKRCCATRRTSCTRSTTCCSSIRTLECSTSKQRALQHPEGQVHQRLDYATQLPYNTQLWYDLGSGVAGNNLSSISEWALQSWMGRVNYTLLDRYTVSATGRSDGSSRLAPGNKWAFFPSFSAAWQLGDEASCRAGLVRPTQVARELWHHGQHVHQPVPDAGHAVVQSCTRSARRVCAAIRPGTIPNPDLTWEKTDGTNFGDRLLGAGNRVSGRSTATCRTRATCCSRDCCP